MSTLLEPVAANRPRRQLCRDAIGDETANASRRRIREHRLRPAFQELQPALIRRGCAPGAADLVAELCRAGGVKPQGVVARSSRCGASGPKRERRTPREGQGPAVIHVRVDRMTRESITAASVECFRVAVPELQAEAAADRVAEIRARRMASEPLGVRASASRPR